MHAPPVVVRPQRIAVCCSVKQPRAARLRALLEARDRVALAQQLLDAREAGGARAHDSLA
jgi:hypothetical protein